KDLETVVILGDRLLATFNNSFFGSYFFHFSIPKNISVKLYDLSFSSPLLFSSFKDDIHILDSWMKLGVGGGSFKTIMLNHRLGNDRPRMQEVCLDGHYGLVNALGLPGKGVHVFLESILQSNLLSYDRPLGFSIGGESKEEYLEVFNYLITQLSQQQFKQYYFELNISCPNTSDGRQLMDQPDEVIDLICQMRKQSDVIIGVKISPDQTNELLYDLAKKLAQLDRVFIVSGNTQYRRCGSVGLLDSDISIGGGGLSGPYLFDRTLELSNLFSDLDIPVIAVGGISTINHINQLKQNGIFLFGMATALVRNSYCIPILNRQL
ncbi:hypothetical protein DID75_03765, partial [Candidatus Marinamargulisbacteria bacterium SCGC AG-410-N11]